MQEIYSALLLHASKQPITEENMRKVLEAANAPIDEGRIKAVVTSLEGQNIDELLKQAMITTPKEEVKEKKEEEAKKAEEGAAGLGALFG